MGGAPVALATGEVEDPAGACSDLSGVARRAPRNAAQVHTPSHGKAMFAEQDGAITLEQLRSFFDNGVHLCHGVPRITGATLLGSSLHKLILTHTNIYIVGLHIMLSHCETRLPHHPGREHATLHATLHATRHAA